MTEKPTPGGDATATETSRPSHVTTIGALWEVAPASAPQPQRTAETTAGEEVKPDTHRLVYIARPIDYDDDGTTDTYASTIRTALHERGIASYDPAEAFWVGRNQTPGPEIYRINHIAQRWATATIALVPPRVPTFGVPVEIYKSTRAWSVFTAVIGGNESWTLAGLGADQYPWTDDGVYQAIDDLVAAAPRPAENRRHPLPVYVGAGGQLPTRAYPDDAGFDLYVSETASIPPGKFVDIHCGVAVEMEPETWGMIIGRSSTLRRRGLLVNQGVIDPGFRGELYAGVWNLGQNEVIISRGERLAQLILFSNTTARYAPLQVDSLRTSDRGENGFGSSGA